jgi:hypothetical protein
MVFTKALLLLGDISDGNLPSGNIVQNEGLGSLVFRMGLFMVGLLIFCLVCGLAWRKIPRLHNLLSVPQPEDTDLASEPRLINYSTPTPLTTLEKQSENVAANWANQPDRLTEALADGRPVVRAASDLKEAQPSPAIVQRDKD